MRFRRRLRRVELPEDDGMVNLRGYLVRPDVARANAEAHMVGFDDLPKTLRDRINAAESPETGALPTRDLVGPAGPWGVDKARARAKAIAARAIADRDEQE